MSVDGVLRKVLRDRMFIDPPSNEHMEHLKSIVEDFGLKSKIGG